MAKSDDYFGSFGIRIFASNADKNVRYIMRHGFAMDRKFRFINGTGPLRDEKRLHLGGCPAV